jgi:hypothetical protein
MKELHGQTPFTKCTGQYNIAVNMLAFYELMVILDSLANSQIEARKKKA